MLTLGLALLIGCSEEVATSTATVATADKKQLPVWKVATEASYAPFEFRDAGGGVIGFDMDLIKAIAEDQGYAVEVIAQQWQGIFKTLDDGSRDLVVAAIVLTPTRERTMSLSEPYMREKNLIVYTDKSLNIDGLNDIKNLRVSFLADTTFQRLAEHETLDLNKMIPRKTQFLAFADLMNGKAQAVIGTASVLRYYVNAYQGTMPFYTYEFEGKSGATELVFAMKKGNRELQEKINTGLKNIQVNGTYRKIYNKWFGNQSSTRQ